jgi:large subunit ribosomal protein L24
MHIKKGDNVKVIAGKDRGKSGAVLRVFTDVERVSVEGVNVYRKHIRPKRQNQKGEVVEVPRAMNASNVMLICPSCKQPTRVGRRLEGDRRVRYCKKCSATIAS